MTILLLHGWTSTPGGVKPTYLKDHDHEVLNPALPDDDFDAAVRIAQVEFEPREDAVEDNGTIDYGALRLVERTKDLGPDRRPDLANQASQVRRYPM